MDSSWQVYEERLIAACHQLLVAQNVKVVLVDFDRFASQIFMGLLEKELLRFDSSLLAAEIVALWLFANNRQSGILKVKVRVGMPDAAVPTTCIEVLGEETPFLLNTLKLHLQKTGLTPILIIDQPLGHASGGRYRVVLQVHVQQLAQEGRTQLQLNLQQAMDVLHGIVVDFGAMREVLIRESMQALRFVEVEHDKDENLEFYAFVSWILQENLLLIGIGQWTLVNGVRKELLAPLLGWPRVCPDLDCFGTEQITAGGAGHRVFFAQIPLTSPVNHDEFCDVVVLRRCDESSNPVAEIRIAGLYTSRMLQSDPNTVPVLRDKLSSLRNQCGFHSLSADARNLERIMRFLPRSRLLMAGASDLAPTIRDMVLQRRPRQNKFIWWSAGFGSMLYLTMFVPKLLYRERLGEEYLKLFAMYLQVDAVRFDVLVSSYLWVRLDFRCAVQSLPTLEQRTEIEQHCNDLSRNWSQELHLLIDADERCSAGQDIGLLLWSTEFQQRHTPKEALAICHLIVPLLGTECLQVALKNAKTVDHGSTELIVQVAKWHDAIWLSDLLPVIEEFGFRVQKEYSYRVELRGQTIVVHELVVCAGKTIDLPQLTALEDSIRECLLQKAVVDGFNRLMLICGMTGWRVQMFRAYAAYQQQLGWLPLPGIIAEVLIRHPEAVLLLWQRFAQRFDPAAPQQDEVSAFEQWNRLWQKYLAQVQVRSDDEVLRRYVSLIQASVRTNFFNASVRDSQVLALKLEPARMDGVPLPKPWREIWVFAPDFAGIHLRFGPFARGGIRWSDRPDDFRTEILGLVKAQQVKNAVIVPVGAKGGFSLRNSALIMGSEPWRQAGTAAYDAFITALLELTDNQQSAQIIPALGVRRDTDDAYLVVAADKGTATFSDRANAISESRQFWLGDAFASGGQYGYDHKVLGITARGAFISLSRHRWFLGQPSGGFSAIGIGDMSGDVFGNGMLLAQDMRLLAAFNHAHIFIDPNPDPLRSWNERQRLFQLPRSTWLDYDLSSVSVGGGVYSRSQKSIELSEQACAALDVPHGPLSPEQLIRALLCASVDVIWNGGIGTYVKSSTESHIDVGDRANDSLRVNGQQMRARVFCEGGNLGMTQLGRVEYSLSGGLCHTDFIDNSAGVDCSDREVNIKIALQGLVSSGVCTLEQRNQLLASLQDEVKERVLYDNRQQALLLSVAVAQQPSRHNEYADFMAFLELEVGLDRHLEGLPDVRIWQQRQRQQQWLTRPELSVLLAYAKNDLKQRLTQLCLADDVDCRDDLLRAFTPTLIEKHRELLMRHPLRHALAGTELANDFIHKLGITSMQRLKQRSGVQLLDQVRVFVRMRCLFELDALWAQIQINTSLDRLELLEVADQVMRLSRLIVLWWTGEQDLQVDTTTLAQIQQVLPRKSSLLQERCATDGVLQEFVRRLENGVVSLECARIATLSGASLVDAVSSYLTVESAIGFELLRQQLLSRPVLNIWQAHANESYIEQWRSMQRLLCLQLLQGQLVLNESSLQEWQGMLRRLVPMDFQETSLYAVLTQKLQALMDRKFE